MTEEMTCLSINFYFLFGISVYIEVHMGVGTYFFLVGKWVSNGDGAVFFFFFLGRKPGTSHLTSPSCETEVVVTSQF